MDNTDKQKIDALAKELGEDAVAIGKAIAAYKQKGKAGFIEILPQLLAELKDDVTVVKEAAPIIKAGYKTTEFWLCAALVGGNAAYATTTGNVLPFDVNAVLGGVVAVYTFVRSLVKKA